MFPVVQSTHLVGIALLVGAIILVDLRILGFGARRDTASQLAARLASFARAGLAIMVVTGPLLFIADAARYASNPAFRFKMALLLIALASHVTIHRKHTRLGAILSMMLWTGVVVGGRAIADFDV